MSPRVFPSIFFSLAPFLFFFALRTEAAAQCASPVNPVVAENCLPGNDPGEWDVSSRDAGDPTIQGFATDISFNVGGTVYFKINTPAHAYTINVYRLGYYAGSGARKVATVTPSVALPQTQPSCLADTTTNLLDCGNWAVSASWQIPTTAASGIYFAHLIRTDTGGDSHIVFIVRNDSGHSDVLYQTSDLTWQAYNYYGGGSLYGPGSNTFSLPSRSSKVSYNRPFATRGFSMESASWLFGPEYPMVRWLEANGYDVSYFTGVDAARTGNLIQNHRVYISNGHDEYWSGTQRTNVEAARNAGVNMAFFSGNEVFWKTRWENSIDGSNTPYRTMVCYKETLSPTKLDPADPPTWTGTWRDPTFSPPADGGRPENSLTGSIFMVNGIAPDNPGTLSIKIPSDDGKMRFWRNTSVASLASGASYTLPAGTLGFEWDEDLDNGARPAGAFHLSTATYPLTTDLLLDYGATYGAGAATHHLMTYRSPSGALVFGAGTVQWSWGLDSNHDNPFGSNQSPDANMKQATVNLFADMGVQPATLQAGLLAATLSTDKSAPASQVTSPSAGSAILVGSPATASGTASDSGGAVAGVEVSVDGGGTWHPATGRASWTYSWTPTVVGNTSILSRAVDDSGNLENPSTSVPINVMAHDCPCTSLSPSAIPGIPDSGDPAAGEYGVNFRADYNGYVTGVRFYKGSANTGTHTGSLWSSTGTRLATATFMSESASGWQQVSFGTPVAILANTTYTASYFAPSGHYSADAKFFSTSGLDNPPIHLPRNGLYGPNGVYSYGSLSSFPTQTFNTTNYWVDVVYVPSTPMADASPSLLVTPGKLSFSAFQGLPNAATQAITVYNQAVGTLNWTAVTSSPWLVLSASSGATPQTISVSLNTTGMSTGVYTGTITFSAPGGTGPAQIVSVTLTISNLFLSTNFTGLGLQGLVVAPPGVLSNWSIVNGALQYNGGANSQLYAGNSAWTDYSLTASLLLTNLQNWPGGIRGRVNPATGAGYMLWAYPALGQIILYRASAWNVNQGLVQLGVAGVSFDAATSHSLGLIFQGSQIQATYDGTTLITANDSSFSSGLIALEGFSQTIDFGNVTVASLNANPGSIAASNSALSFTGTYQAASPASQSVPLTTAGGGVLAWTATSNAAWLTVSPAMGITPATLQVSVNSASLAGGTYSASITITALGAVNASQTINVSVNIVVPPPLISASPSTLSFMTSGAQPVSQVFSVLNAGYGTLSWTASSDSSWLVPSPAFGSAPATVTASVNALGLALGSYNGNIVLRAPGAPNSPFSAPVTLQVLAQEMTETFSDLGSGWIVSPMGLGNGWTAANQTYSFSGIGLSQVCTGNTGWSNYAFDTNIKLSSLSNWPGGVRGRVNPATGAGYAVWLYPGSNLAILYRVGQWNINGAVLTQIGQAPLTFDTAAVHRLRLYFNGSSISVYWDANLVISAIDSSYASGFVCLDADGQPISYSNVQIAGSADPVALDPPSPANLVFSALPGVTPGPQVITLTASGSSMAWAAKSSAVWLTATASSSLTPGVLTVSANPIGLAEGVYTGTLTVSSPGATNSPITIPVTLAVKTAVLSVAPSSISFLGAAGLNPAPQNLQISNSGSGPLAWNASVSAPWLGLSSGSGSVPATIAIQANTTSLSAGQYNGSVTVSSPDVANSPTVVPVTLQVGTLVFNDTFSAGSGNWTVSPLGFASGWSVVNSTYSYNGGGPTQVWTGSASWTDYTLSANFQLASLNNYPGGIRGRVNPGTGASYGVWIYPAQGLFRLFQIGQWSIDGPITQIAQSGVVAMDTKTHNLQLKFQGSAIQVYYDNVQVLAATDSTYTQGAVALDVYNQPVGFSNVSVVAY